MSGLPSETPDRPTRPPTTTSAGERRYTEDDLALILNRAAERQEGAQSNVPRYSLADIQEIAAGAGITREHVASVAASLASQRAQNEGGVLGAPWKFRFEESIDGEVTDDVVAELLDLARRELGLAGTVSEAIGAIEWNASDSSGSTHVSIARRGGRTTIDVMAGRQDAAAMVGMVGGTGAVLGSMFVFFGLAPELGIAPAAALGGTALFLGGTWASMRAAWRRFSRRYAEKSETLEHALVAAAQRAVDEGRVLPR
ncbi:MAG TPA: hypothetical protein VJT85_03440 [Gemmatimonadaceae bacterium]|nr:hypothetical protein [Gemmatimonadaceae bacterium]